MLTLNIALSLFALVISLLECHPSELLHCHPIVRADSSNPPITAGRAAPLDVSFDCRGRCHDNKRHCYETLTKTDDDDDDDDDVPIYHLRARCFKSLVRCITLCHRAI